MGKSKQSGTSSSQPKLPWWTTFGSWFITLLPALTEYISTVLIIVGIGFAGWPFVRGFGVDPDAAHKTHLCLTIGLFLVACGLALLSRVTPIVGVLRERLLEIGTAEKQLIDTLREATDRHLQELSGKEQEMVTLLQGRTEAHLQQLLSEEKRLVSRVEDATRRVLTGLPEIFERALWLLNRASEERREIWFVNFALNFGRVHAENESIAEEYRALTKRSLLTSEHGRKGGDVVAFETKLKQCVHDTSVLKILTITDAATEAFLDKLASSPGYESLRDRKHFTAVRDEMTKQKTEIRELAVSHRSNCEPGSFRLYEARTLPIQLFLARIPGREESNEERWGCLVFMLGSELVGKGIALGYYTELDTIVNVYRNFASALMENAKAQDPSLAYDWTERT